MRNKDHHLIRRGRTYSLRYDIPSDLRECFPGKASRTVFEALGTGDKVEARKRRDRRLPEEAGAAPKDIDEAIERLPVSLKQRVRFDVEKRTLAVTRALSRDDRNHLQLAFAKPMAIISESGLYKLIMRSDKPVAEPEVSESTSVQGDQGPSAVRVFETVCKQPGDCTSSLGTSSSIARSMAAKVTTAKDFLKVSQWALMLPFSEDTPP